MLNFDIIYKAHRINFIIMDNKEHYNQFLMYLDVAKSQEINSINLKELEYIQILKLLEVEL